MVEQIQFVLILVIFLIVFVAIFLIVVQMREPEFGKKGALAIANAVKSFSFFIGEALGRVFQTIIWF